MISILPITSQNPTVIKPLSPMKSLSPVPQKSTFAEDTKTKNINKSNNNTKNNNNITHHNPKKNTHSHSKKKKNSTASHLLERAKCYFEKGFFVLALKDALKCIQIDNTIHKAYYIASICYLEMYDIENAEKYSLSKKKKLKELISKKKNEIATKTILYKSYPLFIKFIHELYANNCFFPKLDIHFHSNDYRGIISKKKINKNEIIMSIPKDCLITLEKVLETNYGKQIGKIMYKDLNSPKHCLLSSFLLFEEKNPKWQFYFETFPKNFGNFPIFYTNKELEYLKGSPFLNQVLDKKIDIGIDYNKLCEKIPNFSNFSLEKFCAARVLVSSRVFGISIKNIKTDVLVPLADLLNHKRPRETQWYYDDHLDAFIIQSLEDIEAEKEIFDSYGRKTNARFLLNYGFCLENNEVSEYSMSVNFDVNYPMFQIKKGFFKNGFEYVKNFVLNINIQESQILELLSFLRFMLFDGDINILYDAIFSFKTDNIYKIFCKNLNLNFYYVTPISKKLEIEVLIHFKNLCKQALEKYSTTIEEDQIRYKKNEENEKNFNLRNCLLLLMNEKSVLIYYINFCDYCLWLLNLKTKKEIIDKLAQDNKCVDFKFLFYIKEVILKLIQNENNNCNKINSQNQEDKIGCENKEDNNENNNFLGNDISDVNDINVINEINDICDFNEENNVFSNTNEINNIYK